MNIFKTAPAVFAVGETYQIFVPVTCETLMCVKVGDERYYDESNGTLRSHVTVHRMEVPMAALDEAKAYTICYYRIIERKPYFTETHEEEYETFSFTPVTGDTARAYHLSDTHNLVEEPIGAVRRFEQEYGPIDFLILNGDIPDHSGDIRNFDNIYQLVGTLTGGRIPTVFSRGNHDMRGICAENLADYTPTENGNSYFSFRLGSFWGIVLDCGEDKADYRDEYGHTICCHPFRLRETAYLKEVIRNADREYAADGVTRKLVIVHCPFTRRFPDPFNIEEDIYAEWATLLREHVKPDLMLCGHKHELCIDPVGGEHDVFGQPCTIVVGATVKIQEKYFAGTGFIFEQDGATAVFCDKDEILGINKIL